MTLQQDVSHASDFEPSTLTAAGDFDADVDSDADIDGLDLDVDAEVESDAAGGAVSAVETPSADIDFAALFGPVASRWEAMLRWYELTAPTLTH